ncbi:hypothetical protein SBA3_400044 [Candidatus Sulfopaludibacter sp. SbA3]|nr:hypothetical protein SBA3_400044 [Candidatus Sulfopaludibacter sp. SbA3]
MWIVVRSGGGWGAALWRQAGETRKDYYISVALGQILI